MQNNQSESGPSTSSVVTNQPSQKFLDELRESCLNGKVFKEKLAPSDINVSSEMAMSAVAVSPYIGKHKAEEGSYLIF